MCPFNSCLWRCSSTIKTWTMPFRCSGKKSILIWIRKMFGHCDFATILSATKYRYKFMVGRTLQKDWDITIAGAGFTWLPEQSTSTFKLWIYLQQHNNFGMVFNWHSEARVQVDSPMELYLKFDCVRHWKGDTNINIYLLTQISNYYLQKKHLFKLRSMQ